MIPPSQTCVVIPCYKVRRHILQLLSQIPPSVDHIFVIDDHCPEETGTYVEANCSDARVKVFYNSANLGVGGAVVHGYREALKDTRIAYVVKIDGDGQMDPALIPRFVAPLKRGLADYIKGNRFYNLENIHRMPLIRIIGNAGLSFFAKLSTGYWQIFDPTNGFTAIHTDVLRAINLDKLDQRYFFETDLLFRLNIIRATVMDLPMDAHYGDEKSNIKLVPTFFSFTYKHLRNTCKRIFYNYYLRDLSLASLELPLGLFCILKSILSSAWHSAHLGDVLFSGILLIVGIQLFLGFLSYDMATVPTKPQQFFAGPAETSAELLEKQPLCAEKHDGSNAHL